MKVSRDDVVGLRDTLDEFLNSSDEEQFDLVEMLKSADQSRVAHLVIALAILAYASSAH
ncbi:hypothetical protein [Oceaniradius stylonematis]|uniref:hypothetical protein n=1 Tax=Oceaniradius stylonematis TaxID=2184161 RepID=UPI00273E2A72|nr:hypothetical protein [Oceaniradius stylonematis]